MVTCGVSVLYKLQQLGMRRFQLAFERRRPAPDGGAEDETGENDLRLLKQF